VKTDSHLGQSGLSGTARAAIYALVFLMLLAIAAAADPSSIPHLEKRGNVTQLIVDGKPFLALAGELYNNSSTNLDYMKPIWPRLAGDDTGQGNNISLRGSQGDTILRVRLYRYR
jgi:hypothetical protein